MNACSFNTISWVYKTEYNLLGKNENIYVEKLYPAVWHTTLASAKVNPFSQTVPHLFL
jgi:hypothetical protein